MRVNQACVICKEELSTALRRIMDMRLSSETKEFAERNYQLKAKQIDKEYFEQERLIKFNSLIHTSENDSLSKILPEKLRAKGQAVIDCYFEAFALERSIPAHDDQVEL